MKINEKINKAIEIKGQKFSVENKEGKKSEIQLVYQLPMRAIEKGRSKQSPVPIKQITNDSKHLHSEKEPAVVYSDGTQEWYKNGSLHREDGPARIFSDGYIEWWFEGKLLFFEDWGEKIELTQEDEVTLKLKYFESMKKSIFTKKSMFSEDGDVSNT